MSLYHLDFETYSAAPLPDVGSYRYAADPSTEVLMAAVSRGNDEPLLWVNPAYGDPDPGALELLHEMAASRDPVYAHNAQFEAAITLYRGGRDFPVTVAPERWRCTAAMARYAALPASLGPCASALGLAQQKAVSGKTLIKRFSLPQRNGSRILPYEDPEGWAEFCEYCRQDVRTEQEVHRALAPFELRGAMLRTWLLDMRVNQRGIPVNVPALRHAASLIDEVERDLGSMFWQLTELTHTQTVKFTEWLRERGYPYSNLQAATVERALSELDWQRDPDAVLALRLKSRLSFAATKKVTAMLACECGDGRVRGTLKFHGAGTGRWSAELIQPQNFKRPTIKDTATAYSMVCSGAGVEDLELLYGKDSTLEVIASCIRHFIQRPAGLILDADYAAIEARIVCWLAGQEDALDEYRRGEDPYVNMASLIFGIPRPTVSKDQRWLGKQSVLGCGFGMWVDKFVDQCASYGRKVEFELAEKAVLTFRQVRDKVVQLWASAGTAAKNAIQNPGKGFRAGPHLKFGVSSAAGIPFLVMVLPSGRKIVYPRPELMALEKVFTDKRTGQVSRRMVQQITFWGKLEGSTQWGRVSTYGGKLVENATQGTAWDIMGHGAANAEDADFELITLIHDEALAAEVPGEPHQQSLDRFCAALCDTPEWAAGLPIEAEGKVVPYYTKV
jgi:DNA polymerase bacteriophage-type